VRKALSAALGGLALTLLVSGGNLQAQLDDDGVAFSPQLAAIQTGLRSAGVTHFALDSAEIIFSSGNWDGQSPHTLIANNRTHTLSSQFVEDDARRSSPRNTITYLVDQSDGSALSLNATGTAVLTLPNATTEPELDASMAAWSAVGCNGPIVAKSTDSGADPDLIDGLVFGNNALVGTPFADVTHAGWLPRQFFDALAPNGSASILGVTFTFVFIDGAGNATDVDRNGRFDVAFREIYYNRRFPWGPGGNPRNVDIQSVAIHEAGHAFGLAHFGKVAIKAKGDIQYAPKAIMNAVYIEEDRAIRGTDYGSFCQVWANSH
jgi:hypothetical protein